MKEYKFVVGLCGGWCDGTLTIKANNYDEAYNKACDTVVERLVNAFPELEINYDVESAEDNDDKDDERCETCIHYDAGCGVQNCGVCSRYYDTVHKNNYCDHWESCE